LKIKRAFSQHEDMKMAMQTRRAIPKNTTAEIVRKGVKSTFSPSALNTSGRLSALTS